MWRCCGAAAAASVTGPRQAAATNDHKHSVVLCHGLASNRFTFDLEPGVSVAEYLADRGWDTWLVELRGSGMSKNTGRVGGQQDNWCFDDHLEDCRAIIEMVHSISGNPVHFVGHSMGAMLLQCTAAVAAAAESSGASHYSQVRSGVSIGGSLFMHDSEWRDYAWLWPLVKYLPSIHVEILQRFLAPFSFRINSYWDSLFFCRKNVDADVARQMFRKNWEPMSIALIGQLRSALQPGGLVSSDGKTVYAEGLHAVKIPMLVLSGAVDAQCPPSCAEKLVSRVSGCRYECLGRQNGQKEQYGHFDLIVGSNARREQTCDRLDMVADQVKDLCNQRERDGVDVRIKDYEGFGSGVHTKYAMMRLLFQQFFNECGGFPVLHVSYQHHTDSKTDRFAWTNKHLFTENATAFMLLNESHMMSMRRTADNKVVIRDTNIDARLDGFWEFLRRTGIFGGMKICLDEQIPQQGMGRGGCCVMSMVNALLPDDCYATEDDAEVMKLPYIERIFGMLVEGNCSPYDLAPNDWRHQSLHLVERGDPEMPPSGMYSYDELDYNEEEARETEAWAHFARHKLEGWLRGCMRDFYTGVTRHIMFIYFQEMYDSCVDAAPVGADLDDMRLYAPLWALVQLTNRAVIQRKAEGDREDLEKFAEFQRTRAARADAIEDDGSNGDHSSSGDGSNGDHSSSGGGSNGDHFSSDDEYEQKEQFSLSETGEIIWYDQELKLRWDAFAEKLCLVPGSALYDKTLKAFTMRPSVEDTGTNEHSQDGESQGGSELYGSDEEDCDDEGCDDGEDCDGED
ncbi:Alpha/Beta hydrolase protein [Baffinella frigidus]|nr:Alpha/Beta hydrolase protein [Cryptophyta sp. CCMP2293]